MPAPLTWNQAGLTWNGPGLVWNGSITTPTRMPQVVLNLKELTDTEVLSLAATIATGLTTNAADFPSPNPAPAAITTARTAADTALTDAKLKSDASQAAHLAKNAAFASLETLLTNVASWAERTVPDPVKLEKVFTLKKEAAATTSMPQVQGLALTFGDNPGELDAMCQPVSKARSYEFQCRYTTPPNAPWAHAKTSGKSSTTLAALNTGQTIQIRARAIGPNDLQGPWSDIAEHLVP